MQSSVKQNEVQEDSAIQDLNEVLLAMPGETIKEVKVDEKESSIRITTEFKGALRRFHIKENENQCCACAPNGFELTMEVPIG